MNAEEFAQLFARVWRRYIVDYGGAIPRTHRKAAQAILSCRSGELGGSLHHCPGCGKVHTFTHSCNHRACPRCGSRDAQQWIQRLKAKRLPVPYAMVTFTVPEALRAFIRSHQRLCYKLLFTSSASALQQCAAIPKYLGGELGFTSVLHTWTRQLQYHPHIHTLVPMGALTASGAWKRTKSAEYLFPVKLLSIKMRIAFQTGLKHEDLALYRSIPQYIWREPWVVHSMPCGSGEKMIEYLGRYITKSPLPHSRILWARNTKVAFRYTDSQTQQKRAIVLNESEWMRRLLQHVLPKGFARVRHYGWLSAASAKKYQHILALLDWKSDDQLTEAKPLTCPDCGGQLRFIVRWNRSRGPPTEIQLTLY